MRALIATLVVVCLAVSIVFSGKLFLTFPVITTTLGVTFVYLRVNSPFAWFTLYRILLRINSVLAVLYSVWISCRLLLGTAWTLFLFRTGLITMVVAWLAMVVASVVTLF